MKKKIINIIFYLFILSLLIFNIIYNEDYTDYINRKIIKDTKTFEKYKNKHYVSLNLKEAKEMRFSIENNDKSLSKVYLINYDENYLLILLKEDTNVDDYVVGELKLYNNDMFEIKSNIISEEEMDTIYDRYFTNVNIEKNEKILKIKLSALLSFTFIIFVLLIYNTIR